MNENAENDTLAAAYRFVETMIGRADGACDVGISPFWHCWALVEAFIAGAVWQQNQRKDHDDRL